MHSCLYQVTRHHAVFRGSRYLKNLCKERGAVGGTSSALEEKIRPFIEIPKNLSPKAVLMMIETPSIYMGVRAQDINSIGTQDLRGFRGLKFPKGS